MFFMEAKAIDGWDLGDVEWWVQVVGMSVDVSQFIRRRY